MEQKILIVYYTRTNSTRQIAQFIYKAIPSDMVELKLVEPYPTSYSELLGISQKEIDTGYRPSLSTKIENISAYDFIFIGYPIWHGTNPPPVASFLAEYDLSGKVVIPFSTSGGSSGERGFRQIRSLCQSSTVKEGFHTRSVAGQSNAAVLSWLKRIDMTK